MKIVDFLDYKLSMSDVASDSFLIQQIPSSYNPISNYRNLLYLEKKETTTITKEVKHNNVDLDETLFKDLSIGGIGRNYHCGLIENFDFENKCENVSTMCIKSLIN